MKKLLSWLRYPSPPLAAVAFLEQKSGHNITVPINQTFVHKRYDRPITASGASRLVVYDIALLKLENEINIKIDHDKFVVNTMCIANEPLPVFGKVGQFSGWGMTGPNETDASETLLHANYMVRNYETCKVMINNIRIYYER